MPEVGEDAEDDVEYTLAEGGEGVGGQIIPIVAGGLGGCRRLPARRPVAGAAIGGMAVPYLTSLLQKVSSRAVRGPGPRGPRRCCGRRPRTAGVGPEEFAARASELAAVAFPDRRGGPGRRGHLLAAGGARARPGPGRRSHPGQRRRHRHPEDGPAGHDRDDGLAPAAARSDGHVPVGQHHPIPGGRTGRRCGSTPRR